MYASGDGWPGDRGWGSSIGGGGPNFYIVVCSDNITVSQWRWKGGRTGRLRIMGCVAGERVNWDNRRSNEDHHSRRDIWGGNILFLLTSTGRSQGGQQPLRLKQTNNVSNSAAGQCYVWKTVSAGGHRNIYEPNAGYAAQLDSRLNRITSFRITIDL